MRDNFPSLSNSGATDNKTHGSDDGFESRIGSIFGSAQKKGGIQMIIKNVITITFNNNYYTFTSKMLLNDKNR